jgi:nitrate reductase gamma subunit
MSTLLAALLSLATIVFVIGVALRVRLYARTPAPLKIPTTPAPTTRGGVALRMLREVALFESLFRANLWTWAFGWTFHAGLALVLLRHARYFLDPVPAWVVFVQPFGVAGAFAMALGLAGLWARRVLVPRVRFISTPSDHLMIALLLGISASGLAMTFAVHPDVVAVKSFALGLVRTEWQPLPGDAMVAAHLALVALLLIVFPFSKLLHAPGVFFSPTRNQADDPRQRRHLAPWAARLDPDA